MSLDLPSTLTQLEAVAERLQGQEAQRRGRLTRALAALRDADADRLNRRSTEAGERMVFPRAEALEAPGARHQAPAAPPDYCALAADGSHIAPDRHLPVRCYLMNIGGCCLTYGVRPDAWFSSTPRLAASDEELALVDPENANNAYSLEGALLGVKRAVEEIAALARWAQELPEGVPALALVDGSLILWQLTGAGPPPGRFPDFVRRALLEEGFLKALDALQDAARVRPLVVAGYISLPGSPEVANALRLAFCPYPVADCNVFCPKTKASQRPCDVLHGLPDRALMAQLLAPGERSALFASRAPVVLHHYGPHAVRFFYIHAGEEIARIEVPAWVAEDPALLGLAHALALDQCRRGQGYPVALQEAHEQAVIDGADREEFRRLVEMVLDQHRQATYTSEKARSKRQRAL